MVLIHLALECLKPNQFEVVNSHTTVDAPETVYHIREVFKNLNEQGIKTTIQYPRDKNGKFESMWSLIEKNGIPPTRLARYCCRVLKEHSIPNRFIAVGVRASESTNRKGKDFFTTRVKKKADATFYSFQHTKEVFETAKEMMLENNEQPNDHNVWDCQLISKAKDNDEGFLRVGCVGCPFAGNQKKILERFPKYKQNYILAFDRMLKTTNKKLGTWHTGEDVYKWWIQDDEIPGQMDLNQFLNNQVDSGGK